MIDLSGSTVTPVYDTKRFEKMTMQRHDYQRIADALRATRDATLEELGQSGTAERTVTVMQDVIRRTYRDVAAELANRFTAVNPRFKTEQFFNDALGEDEGGYALVNYQSTGKDVT